MHCLFISGFVSPALTRAVCWTLLHSIWQGLIAAAVAGLIIIATRRSKAVWRYNLLSIVFVALLVASAVTFFNEAGLMKSVVTNNNSINAEPATPVDTHLVNAGGYWLPTLEKQQLFEPVTYYGNKYATLITSLWTLFFLVNFLKMMAGIQYTRRLRTGSIAVPQMWKENLYTLSSLLGIHKKIMLAASREIAIPVAIGFFKPVIMVPLGMFTNLSAEQVETVLVHELAHIRRNDFAINLLQRLAEAVFFFNPFMLWLSSLIREEREACCDDIVMEYTSDKKSYLEALVSFREEEFAAPRYAVALGSSNSLLARAKRIVTNENKKLNTMEKITLFVVVLAISAFSFMPQHIKTTAAGNAATIAPGKTALSLQPVSGIAANGQQFIADTVPGKTNNFSSISADESKDGKHKISKVKATLDNGKIYAYTMDNDQLQELSVDGVAVGKEQFNNYKGIINDIETSRKKQAEDRQQQQVSQSLQLSQQGLQQQQLKLQDEYLQKADQALQLSTITSDKNLQLMKVQEEDAQRNHELALEKLSELKELQEDNNQESMKKAQEEIELKNESHLQKKIDLQNKLQLKKQLELQNMQLDLKKNLESNINLQKNVQLKKEMELLKNHQLLLQKKLVAESRLFGQANSNDVISDIIDDLSAAGIDVDRNKLSFKLNNDELIVNGKQQDSGLHQKLRSKYINNKKDHFIYKTDGHSTSTDINNE